MIQLDIEEQYFEIWFMWGTTVSMLIEFDSGPPKLFELVYSKEKHGERTIDNRPFYRAVTEVKRDLRTKGMTPINRQFYLDRRHYDAQRIS